MSIADEVVGALEVASVYMLPEKDSSSKWKVLKWQDAERIIRAALKDVEARERKLVEALRELQNHCGEHGWWLASHAVSVMDRARAVLAAYDKEG